jgi:hypothetical protein
MSAMDLSKMKKSELSEICKSNGIKQYSKKKKEEMIDMILDKTNITNVSSEVTKDSKVKIEKNSDSATVSPIKETKPRFEKLSKKLERSIVVDSYKDSLVKFADDVADDEIQQLFQDKVDAFINSDSLEDEDYKKYVDAYGAIKALNEYLISNKPSTLNGLSVEKLYILLAKFIYNNDVAVANNIIVRFKRFIISNNKVKVSTPTKKPVKSGSEEVEEEADDEE